MVTKLLTWNPLGLFWWDKIKLHIFFYLKIKTEISPQTVIFREALETRLDWFYFLSHIRNMLGHQYTLETNYFFYNYIWFDCHRQIINIFDVNGAAINCRIPYNLFHEMNSQYIKIMPF